MNLGQLRASFRNKSNDLKKPYLFANNEVDGYINEAYVESVDRGLVIYDRESFTVDVEIGVTEYQLDKRIIRVRSATVVMKDGVVVSPPEPMVLESIQVGRIGSPNGFHIDEDGMFVLSESPTSTATIQIGAHRYPDLLEEDGDEPAIAAMYHEKMLAWALKLAYLKADAETFSQNSSDRFDAEFTRTFGPSKTAQQHRQRARLSPRSIKTQGY